MKKFFVTLCFAFIAAAAGGAAFGAAPVKIIASDNGWDSQKFHNALAKIIVEHAYDGFKFEVSTASSTMNWLSLLAGDVDLDIESWTDNIASYKEDIARGDAVNLGVLVKDSAQGLYVPRYVIEGDAARGIKPMAPKLKSVTDLKNYAAVFPDEENKSRGRVYGSIPGWMVDEILYKKYKHYGLDKMYNYVRLGSEATLFASLVSAYNLGEPWVGYCYEPAWVAGKLDLVRLADAPYEHAAYLEGKTAFPPQELRIVSSRKFASRAGGLVEFFKRYRTGSAAVSGALAHLDETKASHEQTAVWFLKKNGKLIDEWLPEENAAKLRAYLSKQK